MLGCGLAAHAQKTGGPVSAPVMAQGIVAGAPGAEQFNLRTRTGILLVKPHSAALLKMVRGGDLVRVYGRPVGRFIYGANVRILQKKASNNAEDYQGPRVEKIDGNPDTRSTPTPTVTATPAKMK